jgi:hypothetical protein
VYHDEEGVVCEGAQEVGGADDDPPRLIPDQPGKNNLEEHESENGEERIAVLSDQFPHFGVLLQYLFGTEPVGLLFSGINEICSL